MGMRTFADNFVPIKWHGYEIILELSSTFSCILSPILDFNLYALAFLKNYSICPSAKTKKEF